MNRLASMAFALVLALLALFTSTPSAEAGGHRQYYGSWRQHPSRTFYYRSYYYKPSASYVGYKHHYVIHHVSRPQYNYYYNPYTRKYWGRCPSSYGNKPVYSMLAEGDRNGDISKIAEAKFPKPSPDLPEIPESDDGEKIDLPPDDLPDVSELPSGDK